MIKRIIATLMLIGLFSVPYCQEHIKSVEYEESNAIIKIETDKGWTILENASPIIFYDVSNGQWFAGGVTTLYEKYYIALQVGAIKDLHKDEKALFTGGANLMIGELLGKIEVVRDIENTFLPNSNILKSLTIGFCFAKDFTLNVTRYGFYTGIEIKL